MEPSGPAPGDFKRAAAAFRRARKAEARCLIGPRSDCSGKLVEAHSIQKAKLRLIADEQGRVYTMIPDMMKSIAMMSAKENTRDQQFLQHRSINSSMMTRKWACSYHDSITFSKIEKESIDLNNEEHCLLLAYRSVLFDFFQKCVVLKWFQELAWEFQTNMFFPQIFNHSERKRMVDKFKIQMEGALLRLKNGEDSSMSHKIITINSTPIVAATIVTWREGESINAPRELDEIKRANLLRPLSELPLFITVYPEHDRNVAILSFPKGWDSLVRVFMPAFWEEDVNRASALLSKTILEETENIMISPAAWHSFSVEKQKRILDQFIVTMPQTVLIRTRNGDPNIPEEDLSNFLYRRDPDFVDNSDPEEFNLFSD